MLRLLCDHRDRLDSARTGTDDPDALAREVHALVRPLTRVVRGAGEGGLTGDFRLLRRRQATNTRDQPLARHGITLIGAHRPSVRQIAPVGRRDSRVERHVAAQVVAVCDMAQVAEDLRLFRILSAPLPVLHQLLVEGQTVEERLGVTAGSGIPIPVPRTAHVVACLEDTNTQPHLVAKPTVHAQACKAGTDDYRIDFFGHIAITAHVTPFLEC